MGSAVVTSLAASRSTSCYFSPRANLDVLRRMARALKPGGRILIDHRDRNRDARLPRAVVGPCALGNAGTSIRAPGAGRVNGRSSARRVAARSGLDATTSTRSTSGSPCSALWACGTPAPGRATPNLTAPGVTPPPRRRHEGGHGSAGGCLAPEQSRASGKWPGWPLDDSAYPRAAETLLALEGCAPIIVGAARRANLHWFHDVSWRRPCAFSRSGRGGPRGIAWRPQRVGASGRRAGRERLRKAEG